MVPSIPFPCFSFCKETLTNKPNFITSNNFNNHLSLPPTPGALGGFQSAAPPGREMAGLLCSAKLKPISSSVFVLSLPCVQEHLSVQWGLRGGWEDDLRSPLEYTAVSSRLAGLHAPGNAGTRHYAQPGFTWFWGADSRT